MAKSMNKEQAGEQLVTNVYSSYWQREKVHGPDEARTSLARRMRPEFVKLGPSDFVLDLGAGRQAMERQILRNWRKQINCTFVTFDIAEIKASQLLRRSSVMPVRGSGAHLPFRDGVFSAAMSSMGLELMPTGAIPELARVLKPGASTHLNVLHPSISSWKRDDLLKPAQHARKNDKMYADFWSHYAREDNVFGKGEANIEDVLQEFGFEVNRIDTVRSHNTSWIEIDATRNDMPYGGGVSEFVNAVTDIDTLRVNEPFFLVNEAANIVDRESRRLNGIDNMNA